MGKWNIQMKLENRERRKVRRENLSKFFYDLAKLVFAGVVIGGILQLYGNPNDLNLWVMVIIGTMVTYLIAYFANNILK